MEKSTLDQLRIEREPENQASGSGRIILLVVMLALIAGSVAYFFWHQQSRAVEIRSVVARELNTQVASTVLNASGYVTPRRQATVSSKFTGKVIEVLIEEGMQVGEGQVLARLDDVNIRASYELAAAQLFSSRQSLKETDTLLQEALLNRDRTSRLLEKGLASEVEMDRARALAGSLEAQLGRKRADIEVASRQLDIYSQQLEDTIIRAPFAGVIVAKNAQPGEMISPVSAGGGFTRTGIGTIVDMSSLEIEIDVNEAYINRVTAGQEVVATLDAYPDWKIPCHVIAIIPTADRQRATVEVRVGFDQLDPRILPDMGVKVAFQEVDREETARSEISGLLVPEKAVRTQDGMSFLFIVNDGYVERRAVSLSESRGSDIMVNSGLAAGERVVTEGPPALADGDAVKEKGR
ncbi:MAG: efflux RND transporter periplasmic adaptor subunit [Xanthomonadales bacterium]|nr:efflux RND transporter periplasmic adaptor subunit [Gammaproteobacteria bacterium]MBT8052529.1 efflux RND transporter periplasmic adaptor subunit [Gammaproteobacteria bacterium]NND57097.1 efflux RND transporter periplasmic adaptor subunit [Xanthomonadales bacterium]